MSKQGKGTGNVHQLHPDKATRIEPLEGWTVRTKYGTLLLPDGVNCVRLADVHEWMARDGKPSDMVVSEMFEPLLLAAGDVCSGYQEAEAIRIVSALHLVKAVGYPVPLFEPATLCRWDVDPLKCENVYTLSCRSTTFPTRPKYVETNVERYVPQIKFAGGSDINTLRAAFPDQGHYSLEDGTIAGLVYALSICAKRFLTAGTDIETDVVAAWVRRNEVKAEEHHGIKWPRHEIVRGYLNRLAVPIAIAHELWGWGHVVTEHEQATGQAEHVAGIKTWQDAADQHKSQSDGGKKPKWTHEKLAPIAKAISSGIKAAEIAQRAGVKRQTLEEVLNKYKADPTKYGAADPLRDARTSGTAGGVALQAAWAGKKPA